MHLEEAYQIEASRGEGESALAALAKTAAREYAWAFDESCSLWIYYPAEAKVSIDREEGSIRHSLVLPKELHSPPGERSFHYHIHPTSDIFELVKNPKQGWSRDVMLAKNPLPSEEDINMSAKLINAGYRGFRIVSPLGVTSIEFYAERMEMSPMDFATLVIPDGEIVEAIKSGGVGVGGIEAAIRLNIKKFNGHFAGIFRFDFRSFKKDLG